MNPSDPSEQDDAPRSPPGADNSGALILAVLAIAAFCGWYLMVRDRPNDTTPLPVVQKPLLPPSTTDTSADLPGHDHYMVLSPAPDRADTAKKN